MAMTAIATEQNQSKSERNNNEPFEAFATLNKGAPAPDWIVASLDQWELGLGDGAPDVHLITVSENATFLIKSAAGEPVAVMRVHRPGYVDDPQLIESELDWEEALATSVDVPVPDPVRTRGGGFVGTLNGNGAEWFAVVFRFLTGEVLEDAADPTPYYAMLGRITAQFHEQSAHWQRPERFIRHSWTLTDMVGAKARWGDWRHAALTASERQVMEQAESAALSVLEPWEPAETEWGLIHADLRPSNVMIQDDELTVIDFDDCGETYYLYDFASAFSFIEHEPYIPQIAKDWVRGYQSVRPLTDLDIERACALSMIRRLQMLGWTTTHREDALPPDIWQAQVPGTASIAQRYLADPQWMLH